MFRLIQSNRMASLVDCLARETLTPRSAPLAPEKLIVPGHSTGRWLKQQLASRTGISANIDCQLPASFMWEFLQQFLLDEEKHTASDYLPEKMTWKIMNVLDQVNSPELEPVKQYMEDKNNRELRKYQLSERMADIFERYLIFRPEWILSWDNNKRITNEENEVWQMALWRKLTAAMGHLNHRATLFQQFARNPGFIDQSNRLPLRISLVGLSSLAPQQLQFFEALSEHCRVDIYFLNPCQEYWGDQASEKQIARENLSALIKGSDIIDTERYLSNENAILSAMGRQGREFHELLTESIRLEPYDLFEPAADTDTLPDSLLNRVKESLLNLESDSSYPFKPGDRSIQVHSCHNPLREVEVLHSQLHSLFAEDKSLSPEDVIVMMPDVHLYAPYIEATFIDLPINLADQSRHLTSNITSTLLDLLALPGSRLTASSLMDILKSTAVSKRFRLEDKDLETIQYWIRSSGIRWGLDGAYRKEFWNLPSDNHNTWRFGADRLILGFATGENDQPMDLVLPFSVDTNDTELLGKFLDFLAAIEEMVRQCTVEKSMNQWVSLIHHLLDQFFEVESTDQLALNQIRSTLRQLVKASDNADYSNEINLALINHLLSSHLEANAEGSSLGNGGITFCNLVPMRSLPFEVVCLMGLNDEDYPRRDPSRELDLISATGHRAGDRSRSLDDRYLMLEAIVSAQSILYISYVGRSHKDNTEKAPSMLVSELMAHIHQLCSEEHPFSGATHHPLQPFDTRYFDDAFPSLLSYDENWYAALTDSYDPHPFIDGNIHGPQAPRPSNTNSADEDSTDIALTKLCQFFTAPARFFMQQQLGVRYSEPEESLQDTENFSLLGLDKYEARQMALDFLIQKKDLMKWNQWIFASGLLPTGPMHEEILNSCRTDAEQVYHQIKPFLAETSWSHSANLQINDRTLAGSVDSLNGQWLLHYRTGKIREGRLLETWIKQLFLNADNQSVCSCLIDNSDAAKHYTRIDRASAMQYLDDLISLFLSGQSSPIPFHPEYSWKAFSELQKGSSSKAIKEKIVSQSRSTAFTGFTQDAYEKRLYPLDALVTDEFLSIANLVYAPLDSHTEKGLPPTTGRNA